MARDRVYAGIAARANQPVGTRRSSRSRSIRTRMGANMHSFSKHGKLPGEPEGDYTPRSGMPGGRLLALGN